ncbi:hypothetical protein PBRA_003005 [Plasmodiophora brassicae]|uniref:Dynein heavy chain, cytoplasmic n=1 Tax=Plasmodiophora brassicae TaxID=37360 RepID=A0A0G4J6R0_PLABS|nr:hypothetical protein PBRA_003005 [Plasmodiophora brassicae]
MTDLKATDLSPLIDHISRVVSAFAPSVPASDVAASLSKSSSVLLPFADDLDSSVLFVSLKADGNDGDERKREILVECYVGNCPPSSRDDLARVAFSRTVRSLDLDAPIAQQIVACQFTEVLIDDMLSQVSIMRASIMPGSIDNSSAEGTTKSSQLKGAVTKLMELEAELQRTLGRSSLYSVPVVTLSVVPQIGSFVRESICRGVTPAVADMGPIASDDVFLNNVQRRMRDWKASIKALQAVDRDPAAGSAMDEIHFWDAVDKELTNVTDQLRSPAVVLTFDLLRQQRRYHAITGFENDSGLAELRIKVNGYCKILRDWPVDAVVSARTTTDLISAIRSSLVYLRQQLRRTSDYPLPRAVYACHALGKDVARALSQLIDGRSLMSLDYSSFHRVTQSCAEVISVWTTEVSEFRNDIRELRHQRTTSHAKQQLLTSDESRETLKALTWTIKNDDKELTDIGSRISELQRLRRQFRHLRSVLRTAFAEQQQAEVLRDLDSAFLLLQVPDALDLSPSATWRSSVVSFEHRIDHIEGELENRIRDILFANQDNPRCLFNMCARFRGLLERPRVQLAIRDFQEKLLRTVKGHITQLQDKFELGYQGSQSSALNSLRGRAAVSGAILWAQCLERQLDFWVARVSDVLGPNWMHHIEGLTLHQDTTNFHSNLSRFRDDTFNGWLASSSLQKFSADSPIVTLSGMRLMPNFPSEMSGLIQEVCSMLALGLHIPFDMRVMVSDARGKQPLAERLSCAFNTLWAISKYEDSDFTGQLLLASDLSRMHDCLLDCSNLVWSARENRLKQCVDSFVIAVETLRDKFESLRTLSATINCLLSDLATASGAAAVEIVNRMRNEISAILLPDAFVNIDHWIAQLDEKLLEILRLRVNRLLQQWLARQQDLTIPPTVKISIAIDDVCGPVIRPSANWIVEALWQNLHHEILTISGIRRLSMVEPFGSSIFECNSEAPERLRECVAEIWSFSTLSFTFARQWLSVKKLWDLDMVSFCSTIGSLSDCYQLIQDIERQKASMFSSEPGKGTVRRFGPVSVDCTIMSTKATERFAALGKLLRQRLAVLLESHIAKDLAQLSSTRYEVEASNIESRENRDISSAICAITKAEASLPRWQSSVEVSVQCITFLGSSFLETSTPVEQLRSELDALRQIVEKRVSQIKRLSHSLAARAVAESHILFGAVDSLSKEWEAQRPIDGDRNASESLGVLQLFDSRVTSLKFQLIDLHSCMSSLLVYNAPSDMDHELGDRYATCQDSLKVICDEIKGLRDMWESLSPVWLEINGLENSKLSDAEFPIRRTLESIQATLRSMPNVIRRYDAHSFLLKRVEQCLEVNPVVLELQSPELRSSHHRQLANLLFGDSTGVTLWDQLRLADIWSCASSLRKHRDTIHSIVEQAQGEQSLARCLNEMRTDLQLLQVEVADDMICNVHEIMQVINEHSAKLASMRHSRYFPFVEQAVSELQSTLNQIDNLFEIWASVQKRWKNLSTSLRSVQIGKQLAGGHARNFAALDTEYRRLVHQLSENTHVTSMVVNGHQTAVRFESMQASMDTIQSALSEFLDDQRSAFPRLYFVGDTDLLEMLANAHRPESAIPHLSKMFAGISSLLWSLEPNTQTRLSVTAMVSGSGESVEFKAPVTIGPSTTLQSWLSRVEQEMRHTLSSLLACAISTFTGPDISMGLMDWVARYPCQILLLAIQVIWTNRLERVMSSSSEEISGVCSEFDCLIASLSASIGGCRSTQKIRKIEHLLQTCVRLRDILESLSGLNGSELSWRHLASMRMYLDDKGQLEVRMAHCCFSHGFEYIGPTDGYVRSEVSDKIFVSFLQSIRCGFGSSPFGPAGTGKTETVKAVGSLLGRHVIVFNCDESFDVQSMCRILTGLSLSGAWGCFDEFNRLDPRAMSSVADHIESIQHALRNNQQEVSLSKKIILSRNVAIFITMNPTYEGRRRLPENLKSLFRDVSLSSPDVATIAKVTLFSQGFQNSSAVVPSLCELFSLCSLQLSKQVHYDFGLRALKAVLRSAGALLRSICSDVLGARFEDEVRTLLHSITRTVLPKLTRDDAPCFNRLLRSVLPDTSKLPALSISEPLSGHMSTALTKLHLDCEANWVGKFKQLSYLYDLYSGIVILGPPGSGKSTLLRSLREALSCSQTSVVLHVISPKSQQKSALFGSMNPITLTWSDGLFTAALREISTEKDTGVQHWIVFDGDIDPVWAENMNTLLDDSKLLSLPSGERLKLPDNVHIFFEVDNLLHATPATITRCGMLHVDGGTISHAMRISRLISQLREVPNLPIELVDVIERHLGLAALSMAWLETNPHADVMGSCCVRAMTSLERLLFSFLTNAHVGPHANADNVERMGRRALIHCLIWAFSSGMPQEQRHRFIDFIAGHPESTPLAKEWPQSNGTTDPRRTPYVDISPIDGDWIPAEDCLPDPDLACEDILQGDGVVIETVETYQHSTLCRSWIKAKTSFILCGPPGSGKTMTIKAALSNLNVQLVHLAFSSSTTPESIIKVLREQCTLERSSIDSTSKFVLHPAADPASTVLLFCDEINLPAPDAFGSQPALCLLRQLIEHGVFWDSSLKSFVHLHNVVVVGACNPVGDASRYALPRRLLRHCPVLFVDVPNTDSLVRIYSSYVRVALRIHPGLLSESFAVARAMIDVFEFCQSEFSTAMADHPHYVVSPRDLSRWVRSVLTAMIRNSGTKAAISTLPGFIQLWFHEGMRVFGDRLVDDESRGALHKTFTAVVQRHFCGLNEAERSSCLQQQSFFTSLLSEAYEPTSRAHVREVLETKLAIFREDVVDIHLVLFDDVVDHVLRISRVLMQPLGHLLLIGASGAGKTILTRFTCWLHDIEVIQIKLHGQYGVGDFSRDLRSVLVCAASKPVAFVFDESNALDSGFLEMINSLLASGEVPGLFDQHERALLIQNCRSLVNSVDPDSGVRDYDDDSTIYSWFRGQVQRNLHVVFTINPANDDYCNRKATSPALFNRCIIDWIGDWSSHSLHELSATLISPKLGSFADAEVLDDLTRSLVAVHTVVADTCERLRRAEHRRFTYVTPRHFLDLIDHVCAFAQQRRQELVEEKEHRLTGLTKLVEAEESIAAMQIELGKHKAELECRQAAASTTLERVMKEQASAELKRDEACRTARALEARRAEISERTSAVKGDLDRIEPLLREAREAVQGIGKPSLDEIRAFSNPPAAVKMALEPTMILLGLPIGMTWTDIRRALRRPDFITSVLQFDSSSVTDEMRAVITDRYASNPGFTYEIVNRASTACGPLVKWVKSQLEYSKILQSVAPMKAEIAVLAADEEQLAARHKASCEDLEAMDEEISKLKAHYAELVVGVESIKADMDRVLTRINNSTRMRTLCAGRQTLVDRWASAIRLPLRTEVPCYQILSNLEQRLNWAANGCLDDVHSIENAILLDRCRRYPLLIDPSEQGTRFVALKYRNLQRTRFRNTAFVKILENCLRFGHVLLIEDVEHIDPILNPLLNHEIQHAGGRSVVRVGCKDIDVAPSFYLVMATRDPAARFTPDLCSRVTFVNYSVSKASISLQLGSDILLAREPEIFSRRQTLERKQVEGNARMQSLERTLLARIAASSPQLTEGNSILDDADLVAAIENIQSEANECSAVLHETNALLKESDDVASAVVPTASLVAEIHALLQRMPRLLNLYQFTLSQLSSIVDHVLSLAISKKCPVSQLSSYVARFVYVALSASLRRSDRYAFAFALALTLRTDHARLFHEVQSLLEGASTDSGALLRVPHFRSLSQPNQGVDTIPQPNDSFDRLILDAFDNRDNLMLSLHAYCEDVLGWLFIRLDPILHLTCHLLRCRGDL